MSDQDELVGIDTNFEKALAHIGVKRRSGRYPWGSGDNNYQSQRDFLGMAQKLTKEGLTGPQVAAALGLNSTSELRALRTIARNAVRAADIATAQKLRDKGMSNVAIGERMGIRESSVRGLLDPGLKDRNEQLNNTANFLRDKVNQHDYVDIGAGTEHLMGITDTKKKVAVAILEEEGYQKFWVPVEQLGTGNTTNTMILAKPGTTFPDVMANKDKIMPPAGYSEDGGKTFTDIKPPVSFDSKRLDVRYGPDGGADKDGVIELRRGVDDISLGGANYAQVRIAVDGDRYLKGMAMYSDNMPDGVDIVFNTNKTNTGNKLDALKKINQDDPEMPFGSIVRQKTYTDASGKTKQSPINIVGDNEEGRWNDWSRSLSSQFLSKQSPKLAKEQLDLAFKTKKDEYDEIMALTNPAVKRKLLEEFSDGADASAVHLKAAGLPRTRAQVILPINSLKDNEIYAPNYNNGEKVVLIRHPHGGKFEIPELVVNNRNKEALGVLKQAKDAVGINAKVAARLSGADFDGDTVLVIPNNAGKIKTTAPLAGLKDFDPQKRYPGYEGMTPMVGKQRQMGDISNLITDMTIKGASPNEIAAAVRHSMVVIDAEKHNLNYKQSAIDNGISSLKEKYQNGPRSGASTLISLAKSTEYVPDRKPRSAKDGGPVDPETGKKMYTPTGETYTVKKTRANGTVIEKTEYRTFKSTKMAETDDANSLSSGQVIESVYANHANKLKSLANNARKAAMFTPPVVYSKSANETYKQEVNDLVSKLRVAQANAPLERKAQLVAGAQVEMRKQSNPNIEKSQVKKIKAQELEKARARVGAGKDRIQFTKREWDAVQAGAISNSRLNDILNNADMDQVRELATPRARTVMTDAKIRRAQALLNKGYTQAEIASALGVAASTLNDAIM